MEVSDLKNLIRSKVVPHFLIFTGEEYKVQRIYAEQIAKVYGLKLKYIDAVADITKKLGTKSMFKENYLYMVRDDKEFMQSDNVDELLERFNSDMLILTLTTLDKRLKFIKSHNDSIVDFKPLKSENLKVYIKREINLSDRNIDILMEICDYNYGQCLLEIDKIKQYIRAGELDEIEDHYFEDSVFRKFVENGTIHTPPRDAIFDFVKAVLQHYVALSYELLHDCKEIGESNLNIISALYNNAKWVLQVKNCKSKDIEKSTGLTYFQIKTAKECNTPFNSGDLEYIMRLCQNVEMRIKTGKIDESIAVEYILAKIY